MAKDNKLPRRKFLTRSAAFLLGCASTATAVYAAVRGRHIEPFLSNRSSALLERFGRRQELTKKLEVSQEVQLRSVRRVAKLKKTFDDNQSFFSEADFRPVLARAAEKDFENNKTVMLEQWVFSEIELGALLHDRYQRSGRI